MPSEAYYVFLKKVLTPARLQHSRGVQEMMGELSAIYRLDDEMAQTAGLLHDAAKDLAPKEIQKISSVNYFL